MIAELGWPAFLALSPVSVRLPGLGWRLVSGGRSLGERPGQVRRLRRSSAADRMGRWESSTGSSVMRGTASAQSLWVAACSS